MNWPCIGILMCVLVMLSCAQFSLGQSRAPEIKDRFEQDWLVRGKDKVTYSRNFNRQREFSYASCSAANNELCKVSLIVTDSSKYHLKTCNFTLDPFESTELGVAALLVPDDKEHKEPKELVAVQWYRVGAYNHSDSFLAFLSVAHCKNLAEHFIGSVAETKANPSRVIAYRYPTLKTSAAMRGGRRAIKELEFGQPARHGSEASTRSKYIRTNDSWVGEEQPVEMGASQGFFFVASNSTAGSRVDVLYANLTTVETQLLGDIGSVIDPAHTYPKTSGSYNRYGLCWKKSKRGRSVDCTQFLASGQRGIEQITLESSEPVDWLALHNLREGAMLLVTGQCDSNGHCDRFQVTKVQADGRQSAPLEMNDLNATCPQRPLHLSMDVTEADSNNEICFHFVCLENKYLGSSDDKISTSLQYRRKCIDQGVVAKMS